MSDIQQMVTLYRWNPSQKWAHDSPVYNHDVSGNTDQHHSAIAGNFLHWFQGYLLCSQPGHLAFEQLGHCDIHLRTTLGTMKKE